MKEYPISDKPVTEVTKVMYFIRHFDRVNPLTDVFQEYVNEYKTEQEVMERFMYWVQQPNSVAVEAVVTIATSSLIAGWRKDEIVKDVEEVDSTDIVEVDSEAIDDVSSDDISADDGVHVRDSAKSVGEEVV